MGKGAYHGTHHQENCGKMTPRQRFIVEGNVFADADAKLGADLDGVVIAEAVASDNKQEREHALSTQ